jgi:hypothetical protein
MISFHYARHGIAVIAFLTSCLAVSLIGQSAEQQIEALLHAQSKSWNEGDIDGFMAGYLHTDDLQFLGSSGLTAGWDATLDRYKKRYPDAKAMGQLTFDLSEITRRTKNVYTVIGKYHLSRQEFEDLEGFFLLVLQKIGGDWKIVADSTH